MELQLDGPSLLSDAETDVESAEDAEAEPKQAKLDEAELKATLTTVQSIAKKLKYVEESDSEGNDEVIAMDVTKAQEYIDKLLQILSMYSIAVRTGLKLPPRKTLIRTLRYHLCVRYGYNKSLMSLLMNLFNPVECVEFIEANEKERPTTIRANLLKVNRRDLLNMLQSRGFTAGAMGQWNKTGLVIGQSESPIGATIEYCSGLYSIQSSSSFLPVLALDPKPGENIVDMAAAPGGKSTYIGELLMNEGILYANDSNRKRVKALISNLARVGIENAIVTNMDGCQLPKHIKNVDKVLLDAPCSGLGIISRDQSVKTKRGVEETKERASLQKKLLYAALEMVDARTVGSCVVYSTCSISVEENEAVVSSALKRYHAKVVPITQFTFGTPGFTRFQGQSFHHSLKEARRIYPHTNNMDGFFIAKIQKTSNDAITLAPRDRKRTRQ